MAEICMRLAKFGPANDAFAGAQPHPAGAQPKSYLAPMLPCALLLGAAGLMVQLAVPAPPEVVELDCAVKTLAAEAARSLQPQRDPTAVFDALQLDTLCGQRRPPASDPARNWAADGQGEDGEEVPAHAVWVSTGQSIPAALAELIRRRPSREQQRLLVLQNGTHYLNETLRLGSEHSGVTIRAAPNARPVLSGGQLLRTQWAPTTVPSGASGALVANLSGQQLNWTLQTVFIDGRRAIRSRYPNGAKKPSWSNCVHAKTLNLPRQARDKRKDTLRKQRRLLQEIPSAKASTPLRTRAGSVAPLVGCHPRFPSLATPQSSTSAIHVVPTRRSSRSFCRARAGRSANSNHPQATGAGHGRCVCRNGFLCVHHSLSHGKRRFTKTGSGHTQEKLTDRENVSAGRFNEPQACWRWREDVYNPRRASVRETGLFEPFIHKCDLFTKTGSGQT